MATPYTSWADQYRAYSIGDPVLVYLHDHQGDMTEGRVVHIFTLHGERLYVIEIETMLESVFEVRTGHKLGMRPSKGSMEYESWGKQPSGDTSGQ